MSCAQFFAFAGSRLNNTPCELLLQRLSVTRILRAKCPYQLAPRRNYHCGTPPSVRCRAATPPPPLPLIITPTEWLISIGIFVLCMCGSLFLLGAFVLVRRLAHTARKLDHTLDTLQEELPGLTSTIRLTGLEMADCIVEFAALSREVTGGLKAGSRAIQATEQSFHESGRVIKHVYDKHVVPGFRERVKATADILEHTVQANAGLRYNEPALAEAARTSKATMRQMRQALAAAAALAQVAQQALALLNMVSTKKDGGDERDSQPPNATAPPDLPRSSPDNDDFGVPAWTSLLQ